MKIRNAFTMLELIFVIVVMGIIGKFGTEFLAQAYSSFIFSTINNTLQANSAASVEFIAGRLQHRVKDSVIARTSSSTNTFTALSNASGENFIVLEWISADIENFRGTTQANWSGIIDLDHPNATASLLISPATDTNATDALIKALSNNTTGIDNAAIVFVGAQSDIDGYGWDGDEVTNPSYVMHPIKKSAVAANNTHLIPRVHNTNNTGNLIGVDVFEYYKLAWTANAIVMENYNSGKYAGKNMGDLVFYFNYQPWDGDMFYDGGNIQHFTIMEKVSTFQAMALGSVIKIQVCAKSDLIAEETYSLCKEKTIF